MRLRERAALLSESSFDFEFNSSLFFSYLASPPLLPAASLSFSGPAYIKPQDFEVEAASAEAACSPTLVRVVAEEEEESGIRTGTAAAWCDIPIWIWCRWKQERA